MTADDGAVTVEDVARSQAETKRRSSGPSGKHKQDGIILREERDGQLDEWRSAAERAKLTLTAWIRRTLDRAAERR